MLLDMLQIYANGDIPPRKGPLYIYIYRILTGICWGFTINNECLTRKHVDIMGDIIGVRTMGYQQMGIPSGKFTSLWKITCLSIVESGISSN